MGVTMNLEQTRVLDELSKVIARDLDEIEGLDAEVKKKKNEDIKEMVRYYGRMTDSIEDRRVRLNNVALEILGISIAGLGLVFSNGAEDGLTSSGWVIAALLAVQAVFSTVSLLFYAWQSGFRYPFEE